MTLPEKLLTIFLLCFFSFTMNFLGMRLFSAVHSYHYIFLFISIGMAGNFWGGLRAFKMEAYYKNNGLKHLLPFECFKLSLSIILLLFLFYSNYGPLNIALRACAALAMNIFSGFIIATIIRHAEEKIHAIYAFDLLGASLACICFVFLIRYSSIHVIVLSIATTIALLSTYLSFKTPRFKAYFLYSIILIFSLSITFFSPNFQLSSNKNPWGADIVFRKWNELSLIQVGKEPRKDVYHIRIDNDAGTLIAHDPKYTYDWSKNASIAYQFKKIDHALIIGPGGGSDVMFARYYGVPNITAVELNPIIAHDIMLKEPFLSYSHHLYQQPGIQLIVDEGRSFMARSHDHYDSIQITMTDTWAATTAGAFSLAENNLYTVEAFESYLNHLNTDGILVLTRWKSTPPVETLRIVALAKTALYRQGKSDVAHHIAVISRNFFDKNRGSSTIIIKNTPLTKKEITQLSLSSSKNGDIVEYLPGSNANVFEELITAKDDQVFYKNYAYGDTRPVYDNSPFFFHRSEFKDFINDRLDTISLSTWVALVVLILTIDLIKQAYKMNPSILQDRPLFMYFSLIGFSFMLIEFYFIQRLTLFLGHPTYSSTVSLFCILNSTAIGVYISRRISRQQLIKTLYMGTALLIALSFIYINSIIPSLNYSLIRYDLFIRIIISALIIFPFGIIMGLFMPTALRDYCQNHQRSTWAWCVNAAASMLGSVGGLLLGIYIGFDATLVLAVFGYAIAVFCLSRYSAKLIS